MNDGSEIQYGLDLADTVVRERLSRHPTGFLENALRHIKNPNLTDDHNLEVATFVVSFCREVDHAQHWLCYGDSGYGAAITFDSALLDTARSTQSLHRVQYDLSRQKALIEKMLDRLEDAVNTNPLRSENHEILNRLAGSAFGRALQIVTTRFKAGHFRMEDEWRLLTWDLFRDRVRVTKGAAPLPPIEHRARGRLIVPYQEILDLPPKAFKGIVLGYSSPTAKDDQGLRLLAHSRNPELIISKSTVAVR